MLKLNGEGPLYLQLYRAIRADILNGALVSGDRLPASRELSQSLSISRNVVVQCYEQLASEGYIFSRQGSGSFVGDALLRHGHRYGHGHSRVNDELVSNASVPISKNATSMLPMWQQYKNGFEAPTTPRLDFQYGQVGVDSRLEKQLRAALKSQGAGIAPNYQHPAGLRKLRQVIAKYVRQYRGVNCEPEQIVITNGSQEGLAITAQMLVNPGDRVIMEEPGYRGATQAFRSVSAQIETIDVDQFGLNPANLPQDGDIKVLYTTPSHQFPTGGVMPLERRLMLSQWAKQHQVVVIEDDYDSEFRYEGPPIESIQGIDESSQTIYMGTFSKIISPVLRTGFLVLPPSLVDAACAIKWTQNRHSALVIQQMLADYLDSIAFIRHLRRMKKRYSERRSVLIDELKHHLGDRIEVHGTNAGIHLIAWTQLPLSLETAFVDHAREQGLGIHTVTNLYHRPPDNVGLLLGYANLSNLEIIEGVSILRKCLDAFARANSSID